MSNVPNQQPLNESQRIDVVEFIRELQIQNSQMKDALERTVLSGQFQLLPVDVQNRIRTALLKD